MVEQTQATLKFDGLSPLEIDYDSRNWLHIATCRNIKWTPSLNLTITNDNNQNLSPAKRRLLNWHYRLGHRNLRDVQLILRSPPFGSEKFLSASRISFEDRPMCEICQYAKAKRKNTHGKTTTIDLQSQGDLKKEHLRPGASVSVDHFESRIKGRTYTSYGRPTSEHYVGGCVFVDHMSGYIHIEHQLGFSSSETIRGKQA